MMRARFHRRGRPRWWPEGEPWPPRRGRWPPARAWFFRRLALAAFMLLTLTSTGAATLAWLAAGALGIAPASGRTIPAVAIASAFLGIVFVAVALVVMTRRIAVPLGGVMDAADRVAAGDYEVRVAERGPRALRRLAHAFNAMTARLESHDRVRRDLMADVAHELRTPLTIVQGRLEGLLDGVYPADSMHLQQILDETRVLSRLVDDLRTLAQSESGSLELHREPTDVAELARGVAGAFAAPAEAGQVTIAVDSQSGVPPISIDPTRIREVIGNLLSNALRYTPPGGRITIAVSRTSDHVSVEVRDTGPGMSPEELARAFDRFYKGAQSRGSGLGLTIARNLVVSHGGDMRARSAAGEGTSVTFTLPVT